MTQLLEAALSYAARGWRVLPLHTPRPDGSCSCGRDCGPSAGKHPRTRNGVSDASVDPEVITTWWTTWPDANVGIATGPESGLAIVDVDPRHFGDETLRAIEVANAALPDTIEQLTGGGGRQALLLYPTSRRFPSTAGKLGPGLDTRGDGGYVVAPPSLHRSGRRYEWDACFHPEEQALAEAPAWLLNLLEQRPAQPGEAPALVDEAAADALTPQLLAWAIRRVDRGRGRNVTGFDLALQARDNGFSLESARGLLTLFVERVGKGGDHPYTLDESEKTLRQAYARPPRAPWSEAPRAYVGVDPKRPIAELVPQIAAMRSATDRATAIAAAAHEHGLPKSAILEDVRRQRGSKLRTAALADDARPAIRVEPGKLHEAAAAAELAIAGNGIFQRGSFLVRVIRTEAPTMRAGFRRAPGALVIHGLEAAYLVNHLTAAARWLKYDGRAQDWLPTDAPPRVADVILAGAGDWKFRPLVGLLEAPTLRPDGSILSVPGYDAASGLYYDPGAADFPEVPENPTRDDAAAALAGLLELVRGFPFVCDSDRSTAVSALLTGLVRRSLRSAPLHAFRAPKMRSGKSMLADLVALLATGRTCAVIGQSTSEEEETKRLLAVLLEGDPVVCYDNIERPFGSAELCRALTQETVKGRILGATQTSTVPTAVTFLATGNNLTITGDLTSRVLPCDIDPQVERPEERHFDVDLYAHVPAHRGELVAAGLTILRAFHVAGRPAQGLPRWGGFEEWSDWVRSAIVWCGLADPVQGRARIEELDPVRQDLRALMVAWHERFNHTAVSVADVIKAAVGDSDLHNALQVVAGKGGEIAPRRLANLLQAHVGRIEGGYRIRRYGTLHGGVNGWSVEKLDLVRESGGTGGTGGGLPAIRGKLSSTVVGSLFVSADEPPPVPPVPPPCPDCHGTDFRFSKSQKPICNRCWPVVPAGAA